VAGLGACEQRYICNPNILFDPNRCARLSSATAVASVGQKRPVSRLPLDPDRRDRKRPADVRWHTRIIFLKIHYLVVIDHHQSVTTVSDRIPVIHGLLHAGLRCSGGTPSGTTLPPIRGSAIHRLPPSLLPPPPTPACGSCLVDATADSAAATAGKRCHSGRPPPRRLPLVATEPGHRRSIHHRRLRAVVCSSHATP